MVSPASINDSLSRKEVISIENKVNTLPQINMQQAATFAGFSLDLSKEKTEIKCPFCNSKRKTFRISLSSREAELGSAHCFKCGIHFTPIQMYAYSLGLDYTSKEDLKKASFQWYQLQRGIEPTYKSKKKVVRIPETVEIKKIDVEQADLAIRDKTYSKMLELLTLLPEHKSNLLHRGLSEEAIKKWGYKSTPISEKNADIIVQTLLQNGCVLLGVPGFYQDENKKWHLVNHGTGILIPQRNGLNQIQSLQIRKDTGTRYISLSSRDMLNGSPSHAVCHLRKGPKGFKDVILTEGPLKADIISHLTGYSVLAVPGVNSLSYLPQALFDLKNVGMEKVTIAYDMDIRTNEQVQKAEEKLKKMLEKAHVHYTILNWDESYKGLDDWLSSKVHS